MNNSIEAQAILVRAELIRLRDMYNKAIMKVPIGDRTKFTEQVTLMTSTLYRDFGGRGTANSIDCDIKDYPFQYHGRELDQYTNQ